MSESKVDTEIAEDLVGKVLRGEYRIERKLGSGGMSHVYLAHQISVARRVVVKVMIPPSVDVERWKGRFMREAQAASKIRHRGVVTIYSFGEEEGVGPFIAMEYVEGRSLRQVINDEAPIEPVRAARIVAQSCRALHAAHEMGVIHRDLKPDNLMLDVEDGQEVARVLDFGVAKAPDALVDTLDGHVVGTPAYMAPEQARNQEIDARADVYSMGIILFELLTGVRPFEAPTAVAMMLKHVQTPLPVERVEVELDGLVEALQHACRKSPDERWDSAQAFAVRLEELVRGAGLSTPAELGAVTTDDLAQGPVTPEPSPPPVIPTLEGPPPVERQPEPSARSLADVTAGDLSVHSHDNSARLAMVFSLGALALAVVAVAGFVGMIALGGDDAQTDADETVIELLDPESEDEGSAAADGTPIPTAFSQAKYRVWEARAVSEGASRTPSLGSGTANGGRPGEDSTKEKSKPSDDDFDIEIMKDPTREKGKILSPFQGE